MVQSPSLGAVLNRSSTPFGQAEARFLPVLVLTVVFSFFVNLLLFVGPLYMLQIYDRVLQSRSESTLFMLTVLAGGLLTAYGAMDFIRSRLIFSAAMRFDTDLAGPAFDRLMARGAVASADENRATLVEIDRLRDFLSGQALLTLCDVPWAPVFLIVCFLFHPLLGVIASVGAALLFILALVNAGSTKRTLAEANAGNRRAGEFVAAALNNMELISALGMQSKMKSLWLQQRQEALGWHGTAAGRGTAALSLSRFLRAALQVAILGAGAYLVLGGEITPGVMIAASIMMGRAMAPVEQSVVHWRSYEGGRQARKRLRTLFEDNAPPILRTTLPEPKGHLNVSGLIGQVPHTGLAVLAGINFELEPGETLVVLGTSGAGKSSLARLIVGFWRPRAGQIRLDGADLRHWSPDQLGPKMGYLPQDVELFEGTVARNIARFGEVDNAAILAAAQRAGAHDMILGLPEGYETQLGPNGSYVSAGQRQRIGLARALYGNPCLIILDEPNSNLDSEGDAALAEAVRGMKADKRTLVLITHKSNLLPLADKALVLSAGKQQGFGPASELLQPALARGSSTVYRSANTLPDKSDTMEGV
ncbi:MULTISPECIES: type I secretion system permease/ATPase [Devosia]|uniref:type I secretion system permease/ATPase n=1 Tax=Devosia TaxID=46913 RepID=UPI000CE9A6A7|nr:MULTISPECIES: type I secretion system permease/ATPase [Devosia]AVF02318.1 type I secretion system permease/ATPase [Devosia sp. I507]